MRRRLRLGILLAGCVPGCLFAQAPPPPAAGSAPAEATAPAPAPPVAPKPAPRWTNSTELSLVMT
ncbi:MAG TPA: hypothetical protein VMQ62_03545, partial [Dongiaceae bacterium]|nr:hypothetical protein [Dongiaceae bacterium]